MLGKQGVVSVFLGIMPDKKTFDAYLKETYDGGPTGVACHCPFWDDLEILTKPTFGYGRGDTSRA